MEMRSESPSTRRRPEILAPAGDPQSLRAAIAAGADAVYLGMARFNARGRAERFRGVTLHSCVRAAREHGLRVYVTLNTLIHDDELAAALDLAAEALEAGVAAAIVQDAGFAALLGERLPELPLHGSTQMTAHQADQAAALVERLGLARIIAARECSVEEISRIAARLRPLGAAVEVFVHGALCFAYSGQCLMSNFAGRRSANRGICAQNCRFDFAAGPVAGGAGGEENAGPEFIPLPVFEARAAAQLISMKDLAAFESVAALADAGAGSLKIEGRLKGADYVAEMVRLYRAALDAWEAGRSFAAGEAERAAGRVFSRGFTNGYLAGRIDPSMRGDKRSLEGEPDAVVLSAGRKTGVLVLEPRPGHRVRAGQGYRYAHDRYRGGFRVLAADPPPPAYSLPASGGRPALSGRDLAERGAVIARVRFGAEASGRRHRRGAAGRRRPPPPLPQGLAVFLNDDPELAKRTGELLGGVDIRSGEDPVPLHLEVSGRPGEPLRARARAAGGREVEAQSGAALEPARARALDRTVLQEHLGRLGGTRYRLGSLDAGALAAGAFLRFPDLHALRRDLVARLDASAPGPVGEARRRFQLPPEVERRRETSLAVCAGSPGALAAALRAGADRVIIEDPQLLDGERGRAREEPWREAAADLTPGRLWIRLPPIAHDEDADRRSIDRIAGRFPGAGVVAGHAGQLALAGRAGIPAAADLYLNASNHAAARVLGDLGARRVTLSLEVEAKEAGGIAARCGPGIEIEVVSGGAVYSMLTRQPFGLGAGERFLAVSEHGHPYRFEAAPGGVTVLYEARELIGAAALPLLAGRAGAVRLDLAHQAAEALEEIAAAYRAALDALLCAPAAGMVAAGPPDAGSPAALDPAIELLIAAASAAHRRHAPGGAFAGHLFRGARALDGAAGA